MRETAIPTSNDESLLPFASLFWQLSDPLSNRAMKSGVEEPGTDADQREIEDRGIYQFVRNKHLRIQNHSDRFGNPVCIAVVYRLKNDNGSTWQAYDSPPTRCTLALLTTPRRRSNSASLACSNR